MSGWIAIGMAGLAAAAAIWVRPAVYRVQGESMAPGLPAGTITVGVRARRPRPGDVVIVRDVTGTGFSVKRVAAVRQRPPAVWLLGDNPARSRDSRTLGWVERRRVVARVVLAVRTPGSPASPRPPGP